MSGFESAHLHMGAIHQVKFQGSIHHQDVGHLSWTQGVRKNPMPVIIPLKYCWIDRDPYDNPYITG